MSRIFWGDTMVPNVEIWGYYRAILGIYGDNGKENGNYRDYRVMLYLISGHYGTQYRIRLYPPFGYSIFYKEYNHTGFFRAHHVSHN